MKLVRPYLPIPVRIEVIARQLISAHKIRDVLWCAATFPKPTARLEYLLEMMFGKQKVHLDHDPPLCLREIVDPDQGIYKPAANDPNFLVYRTEEDHRLKTFVRGDGAQHCDAAKRRMAIKSKRKREEPARPSRWPPKGSRPLQGRAR
jgi:hypothetical protein